MAPHSDSQFNVSCENGFEGQLSGDAIGITACLYAYSHLSFSGKSGFDEICAQQYHWLRDTCLTMLKRRLSWGPLTDGQHTKKFKFYHRIYMGTFSKS
jgi:hypothetical protein